MAITKIGQNKENILQKEEKAKFLQIKIPCSFQGQKEDQKVVFFLGEPRHNDKNNSPIAFQQQIIADKGGNISSEINDTFLKILSFSQAHDVNFSDIFYDLCRILKNTHGERIEEIKAPINKEKRRVKREKTHK
jgi:hypothetical protein